MTPSSRAVSAYIEGGNDYSLPEASTSELLAQTLRQPYLDRGCEYVSRHWTKGKWKRGDLIGKNGSDPETKAQSASYAAPDCWDKISERRVATSTGHMPHIERPPSAPLGWGGYDKIHHWQASGRQVTKDMVEEEDWSVDIDTPFDFANEAGEVMDTVPPVVREQDLPPLADPPVTLHELLNKREGRKQKAPSKSVVRWAGTTNYQYPPEDNTVCGILHLQIRGSWWRAQLSSTKQLIPTKRHMFYLQRSLAR
jgi:hypothetical protein